MPIFFKMSFNLCLYCRKTWVTIVVIALSPFPVLIYVFPVLMSLPNEFSSTNNIVSLECFARSVQYVQAYPLPILFCVGLSFRPCCCTHTSIFQVFFCPSLEVQCSATSDLRTQLAAADQQSQLATRGWSPHTPLKRRCFN